MTREELIATLPAGRLPAEMMQLQAGDLLLLFGLGLMLAAALSALLAPFLERRPRRRAMIRATRGLPPPERALAIARILGHLPAELRDAASGAGPGIDDAALETAARKIRRWRR